MTGLLLLLQAATAPEVVEVRRIWDRAPHCAFTDLIRFGDRWICTFREGRGHVSPDGALRVIASEDGKTWTPLAKLTSDRGDLRDPKISVMPDGRLLLLGALAPHPKKELIRQSMTWISKDGAAWEGPVEVGDPNYWLWRMAWHEGTAYGFGYAVTGERRIRLYATRDGRTFRTVAPSVFEKGFPNEATIRFLPDGSARCLLRREKEGATAQFGAAKAPYTDWTWKDLGVRVGGPNFIRLPDGRILAATRRYEKGTRTALQWLDPEKGTLTEFLRLPSGGDTSYAGLVFHDGLLWTSYYSSHEKKTAIYLAKIRLP